MSKSKKSLMIISGAIAPLFAAAAFGGVTITAFDNGAAPGDYWPSSPTGGAPTSQVGSSALIDSGDAGNDGAPDQGFVNETISTGKVEAQTFLTGSAGFNLGEIDFVIGGSAATGSIHLFQLNSTVTGTSGGYTLSTAEVGNDLLGSGAGLTFTLSGASGYDVDEFVFSGADQVSLLPDTEYAVELWNTGTTGTFYTQRGIDQPYLDGQAYSTTTAGSQTDNSTITRGQVSGGGPRDLLFAAYAAPSIVESTWTGAANDGVWGTTGNWSSGVPTNIGDQATFGPSISSATTVDLNGNYTVGVLTLNSGAGLDLSTVQAYTIAAGTGGMLTLNDAFNGGTTPAIIQDLLGNHTISAPLSIGANGVTIAVGNSNTDGAMTNNTLTLSGDIGGAGGITLQGTSSSQQIGTVVLSGLNSYAGATTVDTGTLAIAGPGALPANSNLTIGTASTTALVQLLAGTGAETLSALTINAGSSLDLGNNHAILSDPAGSIDATIRSYLATGYNNGNWNGTSATGGAIITSSATGTKYGIGYADGADGGISGITSGQLEVKYTLYGDANLDGSVNSIDFGDMAANFGKSGKVWDQGDFNYDGVVNSVDFGLLAGNFGKSAGGSADVTAADWAALDAFAAANGLMADVPEPTCAALTLIAAVGMLQRRRSRSRTA
ncbi:MAG TPA: hypothetical protein VHX86_05835 [Tepidisphaeraceae bacterium]|jgi:hypothetical protein|nr:hypothetical protein [Tepidisphaeraceae bacterium]